MTRTDKSQDCTIIRKLDAVPEQVWHAGRILMRWPHGGTLTTPAHLGKKWKPMCALAAITGTPWPFVTVNLASHNNGTQMTFELCEVQGQPGGEYFCDEWDEAIHVLEEYLA